MTSFAPAAGPRRARIPATVITGFLGAGKTTLIRRLLQQAGGRRIALIVNEFGDVGVDGDLLAEAAGCGAADCAPGEERAGDVVELANGCLCCTVAEDFIPTLTSLAERAEPPDHIVIETSGLALPQPLVRAFGWPEVRGRVTVDGVVTVVDAAALAEGRFAADEAAVEARRRADPALDHAAPLAELFEDQLACADLIVLTKTDLIDAGTAAALGERLRSAARPGVGLIAAARGEVDPAALLGLGIGAEEDLEARREVHHRHDHHHDHDDEHEHDDHDHDHGHDAFDSRVAEAGEIAAVEPFVERLGAAIARHGVLRVKGFAAVAGKPMRLVVQAAGPRIETYFDRPFAPGENRVTRLVAIGESGLDWATTLTDLRGAVDAR